MEGQTEMIFVRSFLIKTYPEKVHIICRSIFKSDEIKPVNLDHRPKNANIHFLILNCGNDRAVISRILQRETYLWKAGYDKIIGLRDMYSKAYKTESREINSELNKKFIRGFIKTIRKRAQEPNRIFVSLAVMEIEAWIVASHTIFPKINPKLSRETILEKLDYDIEQSDPEQNVFHPAELLDKIFKTIKFRYKKNKTQVFMIMAKYNREDFLALYHSPKCESFKFFVGRALELTEDSLTST